MKGDVYWSSAQQCLLSLIKTNYSGKSNRTANMTTMDSTSGWKSWPLKIYQRNYARAGKATWNSARSVNEKVTARNCRAARTSFNPAKTMLSAGTEEQKPGISGAISRLAFCYRNRTSAFEISEYQCATWQLQVRKKAFLTVTCFTMALGPCLIKLMHFENWETDHLTSLVCGHFIRIHSCKGICSLHVHQKNNIHLHYLRFEAFLKIHCYWRPPIQCSWLMFTFIIVMMHILNDNATCNFYCCYRPFNSC